MHQQASFWYGEFNPSIVCLACNKFSIIDAALDDCLFFVAEHDDFNIVEFNCFQGSEVPESIPKDRINAFNCLPSAVKMHDLLNWIKIESPTYLSLKSKRIGIWSLIYSDNQFWFEIHDQDSKRVERTCLLIFNSMKLPAKVIYKFVTNNHQQELDVSDFIGVRSSIVQKQLTRIGNLGNTVKINNYGTRHIPMDSFTLTPDEFFISPESEEKGLGSVQILVNCVKSLKQDTLLIFISSKHDLCSPTFKNMPFAAPYFLNAKEEAIMKKMSMYDCVDDLVLVKLPPIIGVTTVVMILPEGFDDFDPPKRIDIALELVSRALDMCASCDQKRIHLMDPTVDLKLYEGVFGPKFMHLALNHTANNRAQWVFWHCRSLMSYRHYQELRKSIMAKTDEWDPEFKPKYDAYPF
jgi:hypothetical protein